MNKASSLAPNLLALAVAACFSVPAKANPVGANVVHGSASLSNSGSTLTIRNSAGAIINWQGFSIGAGETTRFVQPSSASAVLNRVVGGDPSQILGNLHSNGQVLLINPSGVVFGNSARIDVAGLVASTLDLSNTDFLAGRTRLIASEQAGDIVNRGSILASAGTVLLAGNAVSNEGLIEAINGEVLLAAGREVELLDSRQPELRVALTAPDNTALNVGQIVVGRAGIFGGLVRNSGRISATGASVDGNGRIVLRAARDVTLTSESQISASGDNAKVTVQAGGGTAIVSGRIEAKSGDRGGAVELTGEQVGLVSASVDATGPAGGGVVLVGGGFQGPTRVCKTPVRPTSAAMC
jgi:filamentous hemagglutinin family protein